MIERIDELQGAKALLRRAYRLAANGFGWWARFVIPRALRQNNPTGKSPKACRVIFSDFPKIFSFRPDPNQLISFHVSPTEGRIAIVTNAGWDAVDATALGVTRDGRAGWRKARERLAACRRPALKRTAKPCGPGIRC
jgi:hypothetical protein